MFGSEKGFSAKLSVGKEKKKKTYVLQLDMVDSQLF